MERITDDFVETAIPEGMQKINDGHTFATVAPKRIPKNSTQETSDKDKK